METAGRCGVAPCVNMCELLRLAQRNCSVSLHHDTDMFTRNIQAQFLKRNLMSFALSPWASAACVHKRLDLSLSGAYTACNISPAPLCFPVYIRHVSAAVFSASLDGHWLAGSLDQWHGAPCRGWATEQTVCQALVSAPRRGLTLEYERTRDRCASWF